MKDGKGVDMIEPTATPIGMFEDRGRGGRLFLEDEVDGCWWSIDETEVVGPWRVEGRVVE
jgi:hypothetical protein